MPVAKSEALPCISQGYKQLNAIIWQKDRMQISFINVCKIEMSVLLHFPMIDVWKEGHLSL